MTELGSSPAQQLSAEARRRLLQKRLSAKSSIPSAPEIPLRPEGVRIPASFGQQSMWYIHQLQPDNIAYNMANVVRICGPLDAEALRRSIALLLERHEPLRTRFVLEDGLLNQHIDDLQPDVFQIEDLPAEALDSRMQALMHQPFDLAQGPLIRVTLLRSAPDEALLVTVMHHIIADKWSLEVLLWRDLSAAYAAFSQGQTPNLLPLPRQFADFALWQHQQAETAAYQAQVAYWQQHLADAPALLQFPADRPRPSQQRFSGDVRYYALPQPLIEALQRLSREANMTLFMTLLAAYHLLLHRYTGQQDILVATSVDTRRQAILENSVGYFLNTIVLRQHFGEAMSFRQLLDHVRQHTLQGFANQDAEFEHVVRTINPARDPSYNPIFQTMFLMWDAQANPPTLPGLQLEAIKQDPRIAKFDLSTYVQTHADKTLLAFEYATDLFDGSSIDRLAAHFETLLQSIVAAPEADISTLNLLPDAERQRLLIDWNATAQDYPREARIHDLIAAHPAHAIAVQDASGSLSYGDLNRRANQLAHSLIAQGIGPGQSVAIIAERSLAMFVGILGILKAGGAYVPIDPDYPPERIAYMLRDANIGLILTQTHLLPRFSSFEQPCLDLADDRLNDQPEHAPNSSVQAQDLAYIIYTSGSTGQPKGVRVSHRNLVHSTTARFSVYPHEVGRFLLLSSFAFDSSLAGIFWALCQGGTLCLPSHQGERDVAEIARLIENWQISHMLALPSLYQILLEFVAPGQLSSLNTVIVAGEACPLPLVQAHYAALPQADLYNEYGPTEGSVWSTVWRIAPDAQQIHIGRPIPNMQVYIVDEQLQPVPTGVVGEILIGGEGIALGYQGRPDLTAERFIDNPFGTGRLYRTGDLGRWLPDGAILFLGRRDHQVKISGYRIELSEIEAVLQVHPAVGEAVVIVHEGGASPVLLAFVSAAASLDEAALRQHLQAHLPRYMLPARLFILPGLPQTPNGKLDRAALLAHLDTPEASVAPTLIAPSDETETQLQAIWADVLGRPVPDTRASFFDLGGSSLQAVRLFARIQDAFAQSLPLSLIMEAPSIQSLAENLRRRDAATRSLFTLQAEGEGAGIFLFQVNRFGLIHYQKLIEGLGKSRPIYGLSIPEESAEQALSLHEIAGQFVARVREKQPEGPYYFMGLSVAGVLAFEAARILAEQGIHDVYVIMFDTLGPAYPEIVPLTQAIPGKIAAFARQFRGGDAAFRAFLLRDLAWQLRSRGSFFLYKIFSRYQTRLGMRILRGERDELRDGGEAVREQLQAYFSKAQPAEVRILLYRSQVQPIHARHAWALHWDRYVPPTHVQVQAVSGSHSTLLRDKSVEPIIAHLREWLAKSP